MKGLLIGDESEVAKLRALLTDVESEAKVLKEEETRLKVSLIDVKGEAIRPKEEMPGCRGRLLKLKRKNPLLSTIS